MFTAYMFNPDNTAICIAFATLFILSLVYIIGAFAWSGIRPWQLIQLSFRSAKIQIAAIIILAAIIVAGLIEDSWREALSGICTCGSLVVLYIGCAISQKCIE